MTDRAVERISHSENGTTEIAGGVDQDIKRSTPAVQLKEIWMNLSNELCKLMCLHFHLIEGISTLQTLSGIPLRTWT